MSKNTQRAIVWLVFAAGIVLGLLGWATDVYSSMAGTIIFLCFFFVSIALKILWGLKKEK